MKIKYEWNRLLLIIFDIEIGTLILVKWASVLALNRDNKKRRKAESESTVCHAAIETL